MYEIENKVVLITGGANGIGAAVVNIFLRSRAKYVAVLDIDNDSGSRFENELSKQGFKNFKFIECDITKDDELYKACDDVLKDNGQIDVIINNAAVGQETMDTYKMLIEINFTALVTSTLKGIQIMRKDTGGKGGTIINISSVAALMQVSPTYFIYCGSKSAVLQFSNCIGMHEYHSRTGVRVLTICFGSTDTTMITRMKSFDSVVDEKKETIFNKFPRQTEKSAAQGVADVYKNGNSGDTWLVHNNKPALNITEKVKKAYSILSDDVFL